MTVVQEHSGEVPDLCKRLQEARNVLLSFDGARRGSGLGAAAWILWVRDKNGVYEKVSPWWSCVEGKLSDGGQNVKP